VPQYEEVFMFQDQAPTEYLQNLLEVLRHKSEVRNLHQIEMKTYKTECKTESQKKKM